MSSLELLFLSVFGKIAENCIFVWQVLFCILLEIKLLHPHTFYGQTHIICISATKAFLGGFFVSETRAQRKFPARSWKHHQKISTIMFPFRFDYTSELFYSELASVLVSSYFSSMKWTPSALISFLVFCLLFVALALPSCGILASPVYPLWYGSSRWVSSRVLCQVRLPLFLCSRSQRCVWWMLTVPCPVSVLAACECFPNFCPSPKFENILSRYDLNIVSSIGLNL